MLEDLDREITSAKSDETASAYPIKTLAFVKRDGSYFTYEVTVGRRLPHLRAESPVLLKMHSTTLIPAQVVAATKHKLRLASTQLLPTQAPDGARVIIDDSWLLERQRSRLGQLRECVASGIDANVANVDLAQLVVGEGNFDDNTIPAVAEAPAEILDSLNERQQDAVRAGLVRRSLWLWGPPGTGKSTSLASLIHAQVLAGRRVLVLAPSNAATDILALALATRLTGLPRFNRGLMLRVGPRPSNELRARFGSQVVPQDVAERLTNEAYAPLVEALKEEIAYCKSTIAGLQHHHTAVAKRVYRRQCDSEEQLAQLIRSQESLEERRCEQLLDECQVLVTPIHNVYLSRQLRGRFDQIVVDEVSMATLPQLFLAVALFSRLPTAEGCSSQVILAGDYNQLPAPVVHQRSDEVPWLVRDVFHKVGIPDDVARDDDPPYLVMLTEQYRMAKPICDFISRLFYKGRLTTARQIASRPCPPWALGLGSLVLVDTSLLNPQAVIPAGTRSRQNAVHALVARQLVESLTNEADGSSAGSLLVLSPYSSQVELLQETLAPLRRRVGSRVRVSSVHRAQGGEADTVVLSLDDASGARMSQFMLARDWTSAGSRMLNVAVSRSRGRVVILAAVSYLKKNGGPVVRHFLAELEDAGQVISPADL